MATPFASRDHYQVSTTRCFCGQGFESLLLLDVHLYGRELATALALDRMAAIEAIHAKAAEDPNKSEVPDAGRS